MHERAEKVGATLSICELPTEGTEPELVLPGRLFRRREIVVERRKWMKRDFERGRIAMTTPRKIRVLLDDHPLLRKGIAVESRRKRI